MATPPSMARARLCPLYRTMLPARLVARQPWPHRPHRPHRPQRQNAAAEAMSGGAARIALGRRLAAEGVGAFFLFATVIGSGIMAENFSRGNDAVALLGNAGATGAMLFVLIAMLAPISGAHMNPAVSLV